MILKLPGQNRIRNRMRLLEAQRRGADCFIDTAGYTRAARSIKTGEIIESPKDISK